MKTTLRTLALFAALLACGYAQAMPPLYPCSPYQTVCQKPPPVCKYTPIVLMLFPWYFATTTQPHCPWY